MSSSYLIRKIWKLFNYLLFFYLHNSLQTTATCVKYFKLTRNLLRGRLQRNTIKKQKYVLKATTICIKMSYMSCIKCQKYWKRSAIVQDVQMRDQCKSSQIHVRCIITARAVCVNVTHIETTIGFWSKIQERRLCCGSWSASTGSVSPTKWTITFLWLTSFTIKDHYAHQVDQPETSPDQHEYRRVEQISGKCRSVSKSLIFRSKAFQMTFSYH